MLADAVATCFYYSSTERSLVQCTPAQFALKSPETSSDAEKNPFTTMWQLKERRSLDKRGSSRYFTKLTAFERRRRWQWDTKKEVQQNWKWFLVILLRLLPLERDGCTAPVGHRALLSNLVPESIVVNGFNRRVIWRGVEFYCGFFRRVQTGEPL